MFIACECIFQGHKILAASPGAAIGLEYFSDEFFSLSQAVCCGLIGAWIWETLSWHGKGFLAGSLFLWILAQCPNEERDYLSHLFQPSYLDATKSFFRYCQCADNSLVPNLFWVSEACHRTFLHQSPYLCLAGDYGFTLQLPPQIVGWCELGRRTYMPIPLQKACQALAALT